MYKCWWLRTVILQINCEDLGCLICFKFSFLCPVRLSHSKTPFFRMLVQWKNPFSVMSETKGLRAYFNSGDIFGSQTHTKETGPVSARQRIQKENFWAVTCLAVPSFKANCLHSRNAQPVTIKITVHKANSCGKGFRMHYFILPKNPVRNVLLLLFF